MMMLKTLDNAIQVLNCFTAQKKAWGVRELARELDVSHTAVNRIVKTYERNGFLTQDAETKKYQLGLKFIEFSQIIRERMSITEDILPIMEKIAAKTKESIFLTWKENNDGVTLAIAESEERIKFRCQSALEHRFMWALLAKSLWLFCRKKNSLPLSIKD